VRAAARAANRGDRRRRPRLVDRQGDRRAARRAHRLRDPGRQGGHFLHRSRRNGLVPAGQKRYNRGMTDKAPAPKMDAADLWREEMFTDRKVGTIRRMTPVKADGSVDASRKTTFIGEASLMTPAGSLPLTFEIPAADLAAAVAAYGDHL